MTKGPLRALIVTCGMVAIACLGLVGGVFITLLFIVRPGDRESYPIFVGMAIVASVVAPVLAIGTMLLVERLSKFADAGRLRWRRVSVFCFVGVACAQAAQLLYLRYVLPKMYGG